MIRSDLIQLTQHKIVGRLCEVFASGSIPQINFRKFQIIISNLTNKPNIYIYIYLEVLSEHWKNISILRILEATRDTR